MFLAAVSVDKPERIATPCALRCGSQASAIHRGCAVLPNGSPRPACNQFAQLRVGSGSSWLAGDVSPVGTKCSPVPCNHSCGLDDRQGGGPVGPHVAQRDPERTINVAKARPMTTANSDRKLLPQGEVIEHQGSARQRQGPHAPEHQFEHEEHRGSMRRLSDDGKLRREALVVSCRFYFKTPRTEFWRGTGQNCTPKYTSGHNTANAPRVIDTTRAAAHKNPIRRAEG